ncbi:MAG: LysE family translocator [Alphaproteobacteria bacterium]|nr:MAG: LysE family translocator [Alphaproteobacteria bacterium]
MMESVLLAAKGVAVGIAVAAPVGPVAVLCIRRSIARGWLHGLATGSGAVVADAVFGAIACFGLAAVASLMLAWMKPLQVMGGLVLVVTGVMTMRRKPPEREAAPGSGGLTRAFLSALALTITNPFTIFGFTALLAGFGIVNPDLQPSDAIVLFFGICLGVSVWWGSLTAGSVLAAGWFDAGHIQWLNWVSGLVIVVFGVVALGLAAAHRWPV